MVKIILITAASIFVNVSVDAQKRVHVIKNNFQKNTEPFIEKMIVPSSSAKSRCIETVLKERFEDNRGNLPWPVDKGRISMDFGPNKTHSCVYIENPGWSIGTDIGQPVKAIFEGIVAGVFSIDEMKVVILQHGRYFTTYSNISNVCISKGQSISAGQVLGNAMANDDGVGEIDFILSSDIKNCDPQKWLMKEPVPSKTVGEVIDHSGV